MNPHAATPERDTSFRTRLASFRNIRPMLRLVWETSPPLVLSGIVLRLLRALLPLATLWVAKLIIDAVVAHSPVLWKWVGVELTLAILSDILGRANALGDSLLADRFTNKISVRLMKHAAKLDLVSFEDPVFYDKLERARRQTTGRVTLLASLLNIAQDSVSLLSLSAGLTNLPRENRLS